MPLSQAEDDIFLYYGLLPRVFRAETVMGDHEYPMKKQ